MKDSNGNESFGMNLIMFFLFIVIFWCVFVMPEDGEAVVKGTVDGVSTIMSMF